MRKMPVGLLAVTTASAAATAAYCTKIRPWMQHWGTSGDEGSRELPGDTLISEPVMNVTRAITIEATPAEIWPWLLQIGQDRGGFYSYDWLENLFKLDIHTLDEIRPELQGLQVNDFVPFAAQEGMGMMVAELEPERALVLFAPDPRYAEALQQQADEPEFEMEASWAFVLEPLNERQTRLIVRFRVSTTACQAVSTAFTSLLEPAHFIMERKMLYGIKERAEGSQDTRELLAADIA